MKIRTDEFYDCLTNKLQTLLDNTGHDSLSCMCNFVALLYSELRNSSSNGNCINWLGIYLSRKVEYTTNTFNNNNITSSNDNILAVGPFQGLPAVAHISFGRGVCGQSAQSQQPIIVPDVHLYPDHIVCDSLSKSEIVIPFFYKNELLGILDIDSPNLNEFTLDDQYNLQHLLQMLVQHIHFKPFDSIVLDKPIDNNITCSLSSLH